MVKENKIVKEKIERRSPDYCFHKNSINITYKTGKEIGNLFNIAKYNDIFLFIRNLESKIKEKLKFNVELNFITLEALKIYQNEYGDFSKLENTLGTNVFYLLNDISLYDITNTEKIVDEYLNDSIIEKLNDFYNNNEDIVLFAFSRNCSSFCIFNIIEKNMNYSLLDNLYFEIKNNSVLKRTIAAKIIIDFESKKRNMTSEKSKEELYYQIEIINKRFDSINFEEIKNYDISVDNVFYYLV